MTASRVIAVAAATMLAGCLQGGPYACDEAEQCQRPGSSAGMCFQGWCAYQDDDCPSGSRFSENAGAGVAGLCVEQGATGGESEAEESAEISSGSSESEGACDEPCTSPPGLCFEAEGACNPTTGRCVYTPVGSGSPCEDDDPCSATSVCDGAGACVAATPVVCDEPPDDCHAATGDCAPIDGSCVYDLLAEGEPCEDDDICTQGDTCDGAGVCQPGPACPTENPCEVGACEGGACTFTPQPDGTSCGLRPADRCCAGTCVDIASDEQHCGGCNLGCVAGHTCESVANTATCELAPADTSGRCTCNGANAQCPGGHVCRTQAPFTNLCTPESAGACPGTFVPVNLCPNYCAY